MNRLMLVLGVGAVTAVLSTPAVSMATDRWEATTGHGRAVLPTT